MRGKSVLDPVGDAHIGSAVHSTPGVGTVATDTPLELKEQTLEERARWMGFAFGLVGMRALDRARPLRGQIAARRAVRADEHVMGSIRGRRLSFSQYHCRWNIVLLLMQLARQSRRLRPPAFRLRRDRPVPLGRRA